MEKRIIPYICCSLIFFAACKKTNTPSGNLYDTDFPTALEKGINLSNWFNDYSDPAQYATRFTPAHFAHIKSLGFTYVRIPIGNTVLFNPFNPALLNSINLDNVDKAVAMAVEAGLGVTINYHPWQEDYEKYLYENEGAIQELVAYWRALAGHFSRYTPDQIFFEVYNEPHVGNYLGNAETGWQWWWPQQEILVQAIREVAPQHFIIAGAEGWNNIDYLVAGKPYDISRVIYNFHFYAPFEFTHQGASWINADYEQLNQLPYPSTPENVAPLISAAADTDVQNIIKAYGDYRWDRNRLTQILQPLTNWARENKALVICNEFGVYKPNAPLSDRIQCITDMRSLLETACNGWAMWELDEGFGLMDYPSGNRNVFTTDTDIVKALGLQ